MLIALTSASACAFIASSFLLVYASMQVSNAYMFRPLSELALRFRVWLVQLQSLHSSVKYEPECEASSLELK